MTSRSRGKGASLGVRGLTLCRQDHPATHRAPHNVIPGSPGRRASAWLSRQRGRPPACHRRGRSPSIHHPSDRADGTTLGHRRRPRRPEPPETGTGAVAAAATASGPEAGTAAATASGNQPGRRRAIGVVAALQSTTRTTAPMGRRWTAEGGPEGRGSGFQAWKPGPIHLLRPRECRMAAPSRQPAVPRKTRSLDLRLAARWSEPITPTTARGPRTPR